MKKFTRTATITADQLIDRQTITGSFQRVWCVWETVDDRGGYGALIMVAATEQQARKAAAKRGWYGGDAAVDEALAIVTPQDAGYEAFVLAEPFGSPMNTDLVGQHRDQRAAALAKLTLAERLLLGLGDN